MEFVEVMKEAKRLCKAFKGNNLCKPNCPLLKTKFCDDVPKEFKYAELEKLEKIITDWSKANPVKTNLDALKETFPELELVNKINLCHVFRKYLITNCDNRDVSCDECCEEFWNAPYEGGK